MNYDDVVRYKGRYIVCGLYVAKTHQSNENMNKFPQEVVKFQEKLVSVFTSVKSVVNNFLRSVIIKGTHKIWLSDNPF